MNVNGIDVNFYDHLYQFVATVCPCFCNFHEQEGFSHFATANSAMPIRILHTWTVLEPGSDLTKSLNFKECLIRNLLSL
jgi:hypothetical protein